MITHNPSRRLMLIGLFSFLSLTGCSAGKPPSQTPEVPFASDLQFALEAVLTRHNDDQPLGISAAVTVPGYRIWTGTAGESHPGVPITQDMLFDVGSVAKNLEAALALKLAEDGRLNLDDPLSAWLPDYRNVDPAITIRQLLNHTSGICNVFDHPDFPWIGAEVDYARRWETVEVFESFVLAPYHPPGEGQRYSSTNYLLLTAVLEKATGNQVPVEIGQVLLQPIGLQNTFITVGDPPPAAYTIAHPWADVDLDGDLDDLVGIPTTWIASLTHPVLFTTPEDLTRWLVALYIDRTVLSHASLQEMLTFPVTDDPDPEGGRYGLGVVDYAQVLGKTAIGHLGSSLGYTAAALYLPDDDVAMAWTINTGESPQELAASMMRSTWEFLSEVIKENL